MTFTSSTEENATNTHTFLTDDDAEDGPELVDEALTSEAEDGEEVRFVDDVEEALDEALAARLVAGHLDDELEEVDEDDTGPEGSLAEEEVPLRRPDEFLCRACFLLKRASQLADPSAQLCRDCA